MESFGNIFKRKTSLPRFKYSNERGTHPARKHLQKLSPWRPGNPGAARSIERGELVALVGTSGSGKSPLMNFLGCLDRPKSGSYRFDGKEISSLSADERAGLRNTKIGFVFQNFNLLPRTSALNHARMPLDYSLSHPSDNDTRSHAEKMLKLVGLGVSAS